MVHTTKNYFNSGTDWIPVTSSNLVFSGSVDFVDHDWTTITLDHPFAYNGSSNVAIIVDDNTDGYTPIRKNFLVFDAPGQSLRVQSDGDNYDPFSPPSNLGTKMNVKNQIRIIKGEPDSCLNQTEFSVTACNSYTWNDANYTESGDYSQTFTAANGCDSVVTLHLTVNQPSYTTITVVKCSSYFWHDSLYTTSGDYIYSHENANGCMQVDTLHLTIHNSVFSEFSIETADSCYNWNNVLYCASGDYEHTFITADNCDSVVIMHLTTSVGINNHEMSAVHLAPNPATGTCHIIGLQLPLDVVEVYDMQGSLVMKSRDTAIDISTLATGIYVMKVFAGNEIINLKLIKQ